MTPEVGLVIRHLYLWRDEHKRGQIEGRKARPCLIIHKRLNKYGGTEVLICPITHTPPETSGQFLIVVIAGAAYHLLNPPLCDDANQFHFVCVELSEEEKAFRKEIEAIMRDPASEMVSIPAGAFRMGT